MKYSKFFSKFFENPHPIQTTKDMGIKHKCCKRGTCECNVPMLTFDKNHRPMLIYVDKCLSVELCELWLNGIETVGCCCGHDISDGHIQVVSRHIDKMLELGYKMCPETDANNGCFIPKTKIAKKF